MTIKYSYLSVFLILAPLAQACGPWLPEAYVLRNDEMFYAPPEVGFAAELSHLLPESVAHAAKLDDEMPGGGGSVEALRAAFERAGVERSAVGARVAAYEAFRSQLNSCKPYLDTQPFAYYSPPVDESDRTAKLRLLHELVAPTDLPDEFRFYLEGALAYYRRDHDLALGKWKAVLDLPDVERRNRSVMAAYMIAKACPESALTYYPMVRELVETGYPDPQGLAAASYGWQARVHLDRREYQQAIDLYLQQWASGYGNAVRSLYVVAESAWEACYDSPITRLAQNEAGRAVLTAYLLAQTNDERSARLRERLLEALPDVETLSVAEAGRFALMEYQLNRLSAARLWTSYAAADDALALWVKSKLLLRAGKVDEGRALMLALTEEMEAKGEDWRRLDTSRAWGELGLLMLREARYAEAADSFWNARSWEDCAYVLERLLPTEELVNWVEGHPAPLEAELRYFDGDPRALLARRLMREAQFEQAVEFFDAEACGWAQTYIQTMRAASESGAPAEMRARHYWKAARIMRDYGMSLFGAELAPDHAWVGGSFDWGDLAETRRKHIYAPNYAINKPTRAEADRAGKTRILPEKRFHYRYRAVHLAELAAGLLPNNDEQAARIYCVAGSWIQKRDPAEADRLYKQLVVRCHETELGRAASAARWFPQVELDLIEPFNEAL